MKNTFALVSVVTLCISISNITYSQAVNKQDSLALVDLYKSTNGPEWNDNSGWLNGPIAMLAKKKLCVIVICPSK